MPERLYTPVDSSIIENTMGEIREITNPAKKMLVIESLRLILKAELLNTIEAHPEVEDPEVISDFTQYLTNQE